MTDEKKLQLIIDPLQEANKLLAKAIKLIEFLIGEKIKKQ